MIRKYTLVLSPLRHLVWLLFFWGACAQAGDFDRGLLWRVDVPGVAPSYLFGTIHSEDPRVLDLPPKVKQAFAGSRIFAMEMIPDMAAMTLMQQAMFYHDGRTLAADLSPTELAQIQAAMGDYGMPASLMASMKPWAVMVTLSMPKPRTGLFLDLVLYQRAMANQMTAQGLETAQEQISVFDDLSHSVQVSLLRETLRQLPDKTRVLEAMHDAYLAENLAELERLNTAQISPQLKKMADRFIVRLLDDRNRKMAERMLPLLQQGATFVAVGALHLYGEQGIPALLQQRGYRLRVVD